MARSSPWDFERGRRGFTLLEILVSVTVLLLLCTLAAQMASGMLGTVSESTGRVTASQKLERLRRLLTEDLKRLPQLEAARPLLLAEGDAEKWRVEMVLPARAKTQSSSGAVWERVIYRWEKRTASLWRETPGSGAARPSQTPALSGIVELSAAWLTDSPSQAQGLTSWQGTTPLPKALRLRAKFTDVWEEGNVDHLDGRSGRQREFSLLLPVGGG